MGSVIRPAVHLGVVRRCQEMLMLFEVKLGSACPGVLHQSALCRVRRWSCDRMVMNIFLIHWLITGM